MSLSYSLVSEWLLVGDVRFWALDHFEASQTFHGKSMCSPQIIAIRRDTTLRSLSLV